MHVEYPLVVRLGAGRPPRMVQRRFRDFGRLYEKLATHAGLSARARLAAAGHEVLPPLPRESRRQQLTQDTSPEFAAARQQALHAWRHQS